LDVPVQFFQSTIAIELAVAGALLWEIRFFQPRGKTGQDPEQLSDPRLRLIFAAVLGATLFGSLWAIAHEAGSLTASAVTLGVAISLLPILFRVLPPLAKDAATSERDPAYGVTVVGLIVYVLIVGGVIALLNTD
jgi:hypothetical protein